MTTALGTQIVTQEEYAILGHQAAAAGLDANQLSALLAVIERETQTAALAAGKQVAMSVLPDLFRSMQQVHVNTATAIRDALSAQTGGLGGLIAHRRCVQIADQVLAGSPQPRMLDQR